MPNQNEIFFVYISILYFFNFFSRIRCFLVYKFMRNWIIVIYMFQLHFYILIFWPKYLGVFLQHFADLCFSLLATMFMVFWFFSTYIFFLTSLVASLTFIKHGKISQSTYTPFMQAVPSPCLWYLLWLCQGETRIFGDFAFLWIIWYQLNFTVFSDVVLAYHCPMFVCFFPLACLFVC